MEGAQGWQAFRAKEADILKRALEYAPLDGKIYGTTGNPTVVACGGGVMETLPASPHRPGAWSLRSGTMSVFGRDRDFQPNFHSNPVQFLF